MSTNTAPAAVASLPPDFDPNKNPIDNAVDLLLRNRGAIHVIALVIAKHTSKGSPKLVDEDGDHVAMCLRSSHMDDENFHRTSTTGHPEIEGLTALLARKTMFETGGCSGNGMAAMMRAIRGY